MRRGQLPLVTAPVYALQTAVQTLLLGMLAIAGIVAFAFVVDAVTH
jgi:hypothetical protein